MGAERRRGSSLTSLVDQAVASGSAFIGVLAVAGVLSAVDFGMFAIPFTVLTLIVGVGRVYFGIPLTLLRSDQAGIRRLRDESLSATLVVTVAILLVVAGSGVLAAAAGGITSIEVTTIVAVALAAPLVVVIDISRYALTAAGRTGVALAADGAWLAGVIAMLLLRSRLDSNTAILLWLGAISTCAALHLVVSRPRLALRAGARVLVPAGRLRDALALTVVLATGVTLLMALLMLAFLGPEAVGAIRGAGTVFGPINTAIAALDLAILGGIAMREGTARWRATAVATGILVATSAAWWGILLVLPDAAGEFLLGATWAPTRSILPITGVEYLLLCASAGLALLLKAQDRGKELLANRLIAATVIVAATIVALLAGAGLTGMALALLTGAVASATHLVIRALRPAPSERVSGVGEVPAPTPDAST